MITCRGATCGEINISAPYSYITGNAMALDGLNQNQVDLKYLYYALKKANLKKVITGTAQPQITRQGLEPLKIPLPSIKEQRRIAAILDKADAIRRKRERARKLADEFLRSVFLDMFGDPVTNPKGWEVKTFRSLLKDELRNGISPSSLGEIPLKVLTLTAITGSSFSSVAWKEAKFITTPHADKYVNKDDFLICRGNGNITLVGQGKFPIETFDDVIFPDTMIAAKINPTLISYGYLEEIWQTKYVRDQIERLARTTSGIYKINQQMLENMDIVVPPTVIQETFSKIRMSISQIERKMYSKHCNQLFQALSQRAFCGGI